MVRLSKMKTVLLVCFLVNAGLVSTHKGEFWPFSIFPMFSQAGHPWSRGVVERIDNQEAKDLWKTKPLKEISRRTIPLDDYGIDDIDYANFVSKTKTWDDKRIRGLRDVFKMENHEEGTKWMITRVTGYLANDDSVVVKAIPLFLFTPDTTIKNPYLFNN